MQSSHSKQLLGVHEWLAVVIFLAFLFFLSVVVFRSIYESRIVAQATDKGHFIKPQEVEIFIDGAVKNPGRYHVKTGMRIQDAIALAEPLEEADLSKFRNTTRVRNGQGITVPLKKMLTIMVTGAVQRE